MKFNVKQAIIDRLRATKRAHIDAVIDYMEKSRFFTYHCHSHHHYDGGLADHAWQTYQIALRLNAESRVANPDAPLFDEDTIAIVTLLHDICDCRGEMRTKVPNAHGLRSVVTLQEMGLLLSADEYLAIRFHMSLKQKKGHPLYHEALGNQLRYLVHKADGISAKLQQGYDEPSVGQDATTSASRPELYDARLMYGVVAGDMIGKPFERRKNSIHTTDFPLFGQRSRYTDDTILTVAIMDWLMTDTNLSWDVLERMLVTYAKTSKRFVGQSRCFSSAFTEWVNNECREKGRVSSSNGAVMRVTPVGWFFNDVESVEKVAQIQASLTHNHPDAICGAKAVAVAVLLARQGKTKDEIQDFISTRYALNLSYTMDEYRPLARWTANGRETAQQAMVSFLCSDSLESAIRNAVSLGTDSDTVGAIVGGIAEAFYREVPEHIKREIHRRAFPDEYWDVICRFAERVGY